MLQSPWLVGIASLFPGLGYLLLKKWKAAFITWLLLILFIGVYFFSAPGSVLEEICINATFIIWIAQISLAVKASRQNITISSGELLQARDVNKSDIIIPPDIPRRKRGLYKLDQILKAQLEMGDYLLASVFGADNARASISSGQYMLGITQKNLVFLRLNVWGKAETVEKVPLSEINNIIFRKRLLTDKLSVHIQEQRKPFNLYTNFSFRKEVHDFIEKFNLQKL